MLGRKLLGLYSSALLLGLATSAWAEPVRPFTEDFTNGTSNWGTAAGNSATLVAPVHVSTGGPNGVGDAYVSYVKTFASTSQAQTIFRGQGNFNSSNDKFVGDWVAEGVYEFSFWLRHNASESLNVGTRFAVGANSPAFAYVDSTAVAPNVWTKIVIDIYEDNPLWTPEGPVTFNEVFSELANTQIMAARGGLATGSQVTFDLDAVSVVPEPGSIAMSILGAVGACLAYARSRRMSDREA